MKAMGWSDRKVVVVAASMGGTVGAPFVLAHPNTVAGYVSVSAQLDPRQSKSDVPALLVWGEHDDPSSAKAQAHIGCFRSHQLVVVKDAPHPAYLKEPSFFNALVANFAKGSASDRGAAKDDADGKLGIRAHWLRRLKGESEDELRWSGRPVGRLVAPDRRMA